MTGGTYGIAAIAGPPLGGVFTDKLTWRWCFWINLPIGAVTFIAVMLLFKGSTKARNDNSASMAAKIMRFDPIGTLLSMPGIIRMLLALQWGGNTHAWNSGTIISLFVVAGALLIVFTIVQWRTGDDATVPLRFIRKRTVWSCLSVCTGCLFLHLHLIVPIWFQAVQGASATDSGVRSLPMLVDNIIAMALSGVLVTIVGQYAPFMIAGTVLTFVGAGLLTLLTPHVSAAA